MIAHQLDRSGQASFETQRRTRQGRLLDVHLMATRLRLGGDVSGMFVTFLDIGKQKQEEERLRHRALHDGLTGLANRGLFLNRAELMLSRLRRRPNRSFAIFFLDLDGFKLVNDGLGHAAGDAVLLEIADRLRLCVRPQDTVARFGGDEFALLVDETGAEDQIEHVAMRLQDEVSRIIRLPDAEARGLREHRYCAGARFLSGRGRHVARCRPGDVPREKCWKRWILSRRWPRNGECEALLPGGSLKAEPNARIFSMAGKRVGEGSQSRRAAKAVAAENSQAGRRTAGKAGGEGCGWAQGRGARRHRLAWRTGDPDGDERRGEGFGAEGVRGPGVLLGR